MALKDARSRLTTTAKLYLTFTATHPVDGSLTFYLGDIAFSSNNAPSGGFPVQPVVASWGDIRQLLARDGQERDSIFTISLHAASVVNPSNGTTRYAVHQLLRELQSLSDTAISIYEWNADDSTQALLCLCYWNGLEDLHLDEGTPILSIRMSLKPSTFDRKIGKLIQNASYPPTVPDAVGKMICRAYGDYTTAPLMSAGTSMAPVVFGYGGRFVPGIVVREDLA